MAANQVHLKSSNLVRRDSNFRQIAESCVYAICCRLGGYDSVDHCAGGDHSGPSFGGERCFCTMQRHFIELFESKVFAGELDGHFPGGVEISAAVFAPVGTL